jgi:uncharacterized protein (DUF427 family)
MIRAKRPTPVRTGPGQESVWDYPRPPRLERTARRIRVVFNGEVIADSTRALRVLETSHPPVYYIPPGDVLMERLHRDDDARSFCEWKGQAVYYSVEVEGARARRAAWAYPDPAPSFRELRDHLAFYPDRMDACFVDDEEVRAQPGRFYGGWVTSDLAGPFKGEPGTEGW